MACTNGGTGTGTTINFQNNCLICLEPESPSVLLEILKTNPNSLRTFQPVLHYLSGTDPTYTKSQLECKAKGLPLMANLPPLCVNCYNLTSSIYRLHAELLECQVKIQQKTEQVRKIVNSTKKFTHPPILIKRTRRNHFLHRLLSSGMSEVEVEGMRRFVQRLHDTIMEEGSNKVIFPSEPPLNFIPLPPRVVRPPEAEAQPVILLKPPSPSSAPTPAPAPVQVPEAEPPPVTNSTPPSSPPPSPPCSPGPIIISVVSNAVPPEPEPPSSENSSKILSADKPVSPTHTTYLPKSSDIDMSPSSGNPAQLKFDKKAEEENDKENDETNLEQVDKEENHLDNFSEPPPEKVIIEEEPQDKFSPSEVIDDDDIFSSSDWEIDTQRDDNEDDDLLDFEDEEDEMIPKKKIKTTAKQSSSPPSPPSSLPPPSPPPLKSPSLQNPPQIFPAPLLQHQAAQILLHLSIPFLQPPPPPSKPPSKPPPPPPPEKIPISPLLTRKLPCEICNEYRPLNHHKPHLLAVHSGIQGHSCPTCHKIFISTSRLVHHWENRKKCRKDPLTSDQLQKFYTCLLCPIPEKKHNLSQMSTHIFSIHERDTSLAKCHVCGICKLKFRTKLGLDFHFNLHTHPRRKLQDEGKFRAICPLDPDWRKKKKEKFFEKPNFNNLKAPCDQCQVNYNCCELEKHLSEKHGILKEDLEKCEICPYRSTKKESLEKHLKICHKKEMASGTLTTNVTPTQMPLPSKESQSVENGKCSQSS